MESNQWNVNNKVLEKYEKWISAARGKILKKSHLGETCFTSIAIIGGKIYSNYTKHIKHANKYGKELFSGIVTLGSYVSGKDTVFYYGVIYSDLDKNIML